MQENKMGVMPIDKLIVSMSLPIMISMLVQALYNIVDSIFVAQINENALTAVSMAFPIQNLMIAVGVGTAVGMNALLARSLGEKDFDKVNKIAENGIFLAFLSYLLFLVIGLFFSEMFFRSQTNIEEIITYGKQYMTVCCCLSLGIFIQIMFERMLQATGKTVYSMITQGVGAIVNIILDPILIFGLLGFPTMGITGAAVATVIGQMIAALIGLILNQTKNHEVQLKFHHFRLNGKIIRQIYGIGIPSIIMQAIGSLMTYAMNLILITFTPTATAVFGVYFKLQSFVFMPVFGLNSGVIPIMSYNYGANKRARVTKTLNHTIIYAVIILAAGFLLFQAAPVPLLRMFNASDHMIAIGVPALRIISFSFVPAAVSIVCSSAFQSLDRAVYSMFISIARQLVVLLPVAYLLAQVATVDFVWLSFPIAEIASLLLTLVFMKKLHRDVISKLAE